MRKPERRYRAALAIIPAPGTGRGSHRAIYRAACCGIEAGRSNAEIFSDLRIAIPPGTKLIPDGAIRDTIRNAHTKAAPRDNRLSSLLRSGQIAVPFPPRPPQTESEIIRGRLKNPAVADEILRRILKAGGGELDPFGADVWEASPIRIEARSEAFPYSGDMLPLLEHLYAPGDLLFIGRDKDSGTGNIRPAAEWCEFFRAKIEEAERCDSADRQAELFARLGAEYPLIMPNPLSGEAAPTKAGDKLTLRGDACVKEFRYIVAESDRLLLSEQGALMRGLCREGYFRIAALIYSGNKSCHAWLMCDGVHSLEDWEREVKQERFAFLTALGFDGACAPPSHMSRLPGVFRDDKGNWQRLLYLAPKGGIL